MKKPVFAAILFLMIFGAACNNSTDSTTTKDTMSVDVNTSTTTDKGDTASYERMPEKINDSIPK